MDWNSNVSESVSYTHCTWIFIPRINFNYAEIVAHQLRQSAAEMSGAPTPLLTIRRVTVHPPKNDDSQDEDHQFDHFSWDPLVLEASKYNPGPDG